MLCVNGTSEDFFPNKEVLFLAGQLVGITIGMAGMEGIASVTGT